MLGFPSGSTQQSGSILTRNFTGLFYQPSTTSGQIEFSYGASSDLTRALEAPSEIRLILQTKEIYQDNPTIRVSYQLLTSRGETVFDQSDLFVYLIVNDSFVDCTSEFHPTSGTPLQSCEVTNL